MNQNRKKMIGYIILVIFAISFYVVVMKYNHNENRIIFSNPGYTIGKLTYFSNAKGAIGVPGAVTAPPKPAEIKYNYEVNGNSLENKYVAGIYKVPFSGPVVGERYIVIYLKSNPKKSRLLFDYPIKDSTDFKKYIEIFKTNPPSLDN